MVNKCNRCNNFVGHGKGAVFGLPKEEDLKCRWIKFLNRQDFDASSSYVFICEKHFKEKYLNRCRGSQVRKSVTSPPVSTFLTCQDTTPPQNVFGSRLARFARCTHMGVWGRSCPQVTPQILARYQIVSELLIIAGIIITDRSATKPYYFFN